MRLGDLSARYESSGDPGAVADNPGDAGGVSYGIYQFATNASVPHNFVVWLNEQGHEYGRLLADAGEPGSASFTAMWKHIANIDPEGFRDLQHGYAVKLYWEPAVKRAAEAYIDLDNRSFALKNVIWSASIQYGPYWIKELLDTAASLLGYPNASYAEDAELIRAIYEVRASDEWTSGSPALRPGLRNRFASECADALAMLESELNGKC